MIWLVAMIWVVQWLTFVGSPDRSQEWGSLYPRIVNLGVLRRTALRLRLTPDMPFLRGATDQKVHRKRSELACR